MRYPLTNRLDGFSFATSWLRGTRNLGCHGFGVFDKAVSSWFDNVSQVHHGLTDDGKTVPPIFVVFLTIQFLEGAIRSFRR